jgi:hypothetical protein
MAKIIKAKQANLIIGWFGFLSFKGTYLSRAQRLERLPKCRVRHISGWKNKCNFGGFAPAATFLVSFKAFFPYHHML